MKSHGAATVGADLVEAFVLANYLEENAYRQYMATQIGQPYVFSEEELALCREKLWTASLFQRTWDHFRAKLIKSQVSTLKVSGLIRLQVQGTRKEPRGTGAVFHL